VHEAPGLAAVTPAFKMTDFMKNYFLESRLHSGRIRVFETEAGNDSDPPALVGKTEKSRAS